jgi:PAS domain S-box-containing protein
MNLKNLWIAAAVLSILAIAAFALALGSAVDAQRHIITLEAQRSEMLQLAARWRRSSDDLTRMARDFAVTGDTRYAELYRRIAAAREGKQPWPPGDASAAWDMLLGGVAPPKGDGAASALADELARAGLPAAARTQFESATKAQQTLRQLEARALAAMQGTAPAGGAAPAQPDPVQALKILYGDEYLAARAKSEQALSELASDLALDARAKLSEAFQRQARDLQIDWLILGFFAVAGLGTLLYTLWRALLPLLALQRQASALLEGNTALRTERSAPAEIATLMRGLNEAAARLEAGARELAERERYLEALLRTSPLGLVLVDARNRVRWTSRRLREFLGDSKQDLKQMPFDEFFADAAELAAFRDGLERKGRVRELLARVRRRDGSEFRARLDSAYVELAAERVAAVWIQAFGLHAQKPAAAAPESGT